MEKNIERIQELEKKINTLNHDDILKKKMISEKRIREIILKHLKALPLSKEELMIISNYHLTQLLRNNIEKTIDPILKPNINKEELLQYFYYGEFITTFGFDDFSNDDKLIISQILVWNMDKFEELAVPNANNRYSVNLKRINTLKNI